MPRSWIRVGDTCKLRESRELDELLQTKEAMTAKTKRSQQLARVVEAFQDAAAVIETPEEEAKRKAAEKRRRRKKQ